MFRYWIWPSPIKKGLYLSANSLHQKKKKEREKGNTKLPNLVRDDSLLDHISPIQEKAIERKNNQGVSFFFLQFAAVKQSCAL